MNLLTHILHLASSSAAAYISAHNLRYPLTRPNIIAGFQLAESGSVPFLEKLRDRAAAEGDTWLAEKLTRHAADETRHGQIFAQALKRLNKQVMDVKTLAEKSDRQSNNQGRSPFFEAYFAGYSPEELKPENIDWIMFLGSTYILELDASKDFARMANVLPDRDLNSAMLKKGMLSIANDETGHAAYLYEAMQRRLSPDAIAQLTDQWRTRKVDALLAMVNNFMQRGGQMRSLVQDGAPVDMSAEAELIELQTSAA